MMKASIDPKARFDRALIRVIQSFNYLDLNVGLCIAHLLNPGNSDKSYPSLAKMTAEKRTDQLKKLLDDAHTILSKAARKEFSAWYEKADKVRDIRNRYVHGCWVFLPLCKEDPIKLEHPPWMKTKYANESMSVEQLEAVADKVDCVFNELMLLRKKYSV